VITVKPNAVAVSGLCLLIAAAASAQTAAPAKPAEEKPKPADAKPAPPAAKPATAPVETAPSDGPVVTIAAERPSNRIDRQVYDVKADVGATNNSAADALNNVPSVAVDPDGTVSLRGNTNVQILIDGKPSAMLQGENRGATLNAMPSQDIESIEVINNPGAQFGNEGGGGPILNLVMRRNRLPGGQAVASSNVGPNGRFNSSLSGSYHEGLWGYQGSLNYRRDGRDEHGESVRERIDPISGRTTHSRQGIDAVGLNDWAGMTSGVTYNWTDKTAVGAQVSYAKRSNDQRRTDDYHYDSSDAFPRSDYTRYTVRGGQNISSSWGLKLDHKGSVPGETFKVDLRVSSSETDGDTDYRNMYPNPAQAALNRRSRQHNDTDNTITDFTGDYERPVDQGLVKLGYKVAKISNTFNTAFDDIDPLSGAPVPNLSRSNRFEVDETNLAVYGSYQHRINERWGVLGGMRIEHTDLDVHQLTQAIEASNSYINYIPSFFVSYKATDTANIRLSYAHRVRRPIGNELNPFVVYRDEQNVYAGNPKLQPALTDQLELGYETKFGVLDTNLRAYYRKEGDLISDRSYFISDTVLLTTLANIGSSRSGGVEFSVSGRLAPGFTINTSGNVAKSEQRGTDIFGVASTRKGSSATLRGRVSYQFTPDDVVQFMVNTQGKALTNQGYREPQTTANLSVRHNFTPRLNLVMNVTDVFGTNRMASTIDTTYVKDSSVRRFDGRVIYIGLSYRIGGVTPSGAGRGQGGRGQGGQQNRGGPPPGGGMPPGG
jgi:outer membrane receptor protein involved in Fe transport